ncbi:hypothetical protein [Antarctobacter jejuensis]|uniref:hypothetical protein n=1 Tax=Antarctobacter jejuensis TaxID=1439938 RepID=UPI003FD3B33D
MHLAPIVYLSLCLAIGLFGTNRKMGFWGYFFASMALTPILGLLLLLVSDPRRKRTGP